MTLDSYKKKKATRRSFVLPPEIVEALNQIQLAQDFDNPSEALRFCVAFTYEQLRQPTPATPNDRLLTLVMKNNTLLRYLLIEVTKIQEGNNSLDEPLSERGHQYLKKLVQEIKTYYQKQEDTP